LRRHLIAVTQRLLAAHGLTGLTTRGIAREAQVSDGVLYNHFTDKDDLVVAALAERMAELGSRLGPACPRPGEQDLRTGLETLVRLSSDFHTGALPLIGGLITRPDLVHELLTRFHVGDSTPQQLWRQACDYLAAEQVLGTVSADVDPQTVVEIIFGASQLHVFADLLGCGQTAAPSTGRPSGPQTRRLVDLLLRACAAG
jgi:AcrR family transcriptional regulator